MRAARKGAVVAYGERLEASVIAAAVIEAFTPEVDLPRWLRRAAPLWPQESLVEAMSDLLDGYRFDLESHLDQEHTLPRHQRLWVGVGRALRAAVELQASNQQSLESVAMEVGYSARRAMDRALRRKFGVRASEVRGTAGWEWLMWRFLCGQGTGKEKRWDQ